MPDKLGHKSSADYYLKKIDRNPDYLKEVRWKPRLLKG